MENTPTFTIEKNWNQKFACNIFVHVTRQPKVALQLPMRMMVKVKDAPEYDAPIECELYDIGRSTLSEMPDHIIMLSHGMSKEDYYRMVTEGMVDPPLPNELEVGGYFFRRVKNI